MTLDPRPYGCLGELLRDALIAFKTQEALVERDRGRVTARHTYREFRDATLPIAARLQALGVGAGDRVAIVMSNQSRWLISAYAALYVGAVLVPIDYKLTPPEKRTLLAHAKPRVLVTEYGQWRGLVGRGLGEGALPPAVLVSEGPTEDLPPNPDGAVEAWGVVDPGVVPDFVERRRSDVACVVYSSGTGGAPKGCLLTHDNYLSQLGSLAARFPLASGDRFFSFLPTNHAIDFMCGFIGPLCSGATVVHQRTLRPEFLLDTMRAEGITHLALVPAVLAAFERSVRAKLDALPPRTRRVLDGLVALNAGLTRARPRERLSRTLLRPVHEAFGGRLKVMFCGGAFLPRERAEFFYRLGLPVIIGYGLTEACTVATLHDGEPYRADSVGRPLPGVEVEIHGADGSGVGEVWLRGPTIFAGYLEDADATAEALTAEGWLRTGDLGWLDASGHLHLVGRRKNMIVTEGGKNVYPEDVEAAFAEAPCEELVVFAADWLWPRGATDGDRLVGERLVAVVRPRAGEDESGEPSDPGCVPQTWALLADLRARNRRLPEHQRVDDVLLWAEAFPKTASMKVRRGALAEQLREKTTRADTVSLEPGAGGTR